MLLKKNTTFSYDLLQQPFPCFHYFILPVTHILTVIPDKGEKWRVLKLWLLQPSMLFHSFFTHESGLVSANYLTCGPSKAQTHKYAGETNIL